MRLRIIFSLLFFGLIPAVFSQLGPRYVRLINKNPTVVAKSSIQIKLQIVVDSVPLVKNTNLKIIFPKPFVQFAYDNNPLPFPIFPSLQSGFCFAKGNKPSLKASISGIDLSRNEFLGTYPFSGYSHDDNESIITIRLDTVFNVNDTITLTYGYGDLRNFVVMPDYSFSSAFKLLIDPGRNNNYIYQGAAPITCVPEKAEILKLTLSSTAQKDKLTRLRAVVRDSFYSVYTNFTGRFKISCTDPSASYSSYIDFLSADSGYLEVPITFHNNGIFTCAAQLMNGTTPTPYIFTSNPVMVSDDTLNIYWGDFHTHTEYSRDGSGDHAFAFAKYGVGLDFFAQTDHADGNNEKGINDVEWADILNDVRNYNKPGSFITFPGYEESMDTPSGHYNMIFNASDSLLELIPQKAKSTYSTIQKIWNDLDIMDARIQTITIPHHTGKIFSIFPVPKCDFCNQFGGAFSNIKYKSLIEVYSGHGQSEYYNPSHPLSYESLNTTTKSENGPYYLQDALALREKLGVIASSDNHLARATEKQYGVFAVAADSLERNSVFTNIKNRHTYGTTGERMVLQFFVNNNRMGDIVNIACDKYPIIKFEVVGTAALESIEIIKWDFKNGRYVNGHPEFKTLKKYTFTSPALNYRDSLVDGFLTDSSLYYMRVKQKNKVDDREVWGWTSPVWINKVNCDTLINSVKDTIIYFNAVDSSSNNSPKIRLNWTVARQINASFYIVQRSRDSVNFIDYAIVSRRGDVGDTVSYEYDDVTPNDSILFYRVKLVTYYDTVILSASDSVQISYVISGTSQHKSISYLTVRIINSLYRGTGADLNVIVDTDKDCLGDFIISDISGRILLRKEVPALKGKNFMVFPISGLPSGVYLLLYVVGDKTLKNTFYVLNGY